MNYNMKIQNSCSFFGHRKINVTEELKSKTKDIIIDLITNYNVHVFLFGSRSEFDSLCHSIIDEFKHDYPYIKRICYTCINETCNLECEREKLEKVYSHVKQNILFVEEEFHFKSKYSSGKASYIERNQAMIDNSDFCIFYYDKDYNPEKRKYSKNNMSLYQPNSGTKLAYRYALSKSKVVLNVKDLI